MKVDMEPDFFSLSSFILSFRPHGTTSADLIDLSLAATAPRRCSDTQQVPG
jgi:hypothetical protein